ncbi:hypothetical protein BU25DRAFT_160460 [Macroventuria anomochaeta]|uniref:Uncharacterized protein n=1 Tax=Macroventuria anomochaeta TaxID=301207 RepID=A0ACB6RR53_9PLEO|nr:uncharacterized protein BU25DRAFT_160460 [Macroventuria anomochaeta]KAF2624376.1 hypothetical protein BU25DRAFT_160460 [Macroventuria anomochaeta]
MKTAAIYVESRRLTKSMRTVTQSIANNAHDKECTVNHCALPHLLESGGNRTQDQPISALHATDGFRAHGNLTPSVDDGSLQRKCFKVGVLILRCSIWRAKEWPRQRKFY